MEFAQAVDQHLMTVRERDIDGFLTTVHPEIAMILPNGRYLDGREAVADFHRDWFSDPDWSWTLKPVRHVEAGDTGVAVYDVVYHDLDGNGDAYEMRYLLTMTFTRTDGGWLLLHDQNTRAD